MRTSATIWTTRVLWLAVALLAARFMLTSASVFTRHSDGFASYYSASRLLRHGEAGPQYYDDRWFNHQVASIVPGVQDIYSPNPPTTALMMLPISWMSHDAARTVWIVLTLILLALSLALITLELGLGGPLAPLFVGAALASQPLAANVRQGQAYVLVLALTVVAWVGFRRGHGGVAGATLAALLLLKTAVVFLPVLFLVRKRLRSLALSVAIIAAVTLISVVWMGYGIWRAYIANLVALRSAPYLSLSAYQTVTSLVHHLFLYDTQWNRHPILRAPDAGVWLALMIALAMLSATIGSVLRTRDDDLAFVLLITLTLVLSPVSLDYHYTLMVLPLAIVLKRVQSSGRLWPWLMLTLSATLILSNLPYRSPRLSDGAWALLAYPKLVGALLLWGQSLWSIRVVQAADSKAAARLVTAPA